MKKRVYFFLHPQGPPEDASYQHCAVALGEGLASLGVPFHSNVDYWPSADGTLFRHDKAVQPEDCDVVVVNDEYDRVGRIPDELFGKGRRLVYIDSSDGWRTRAEDPSYRRFDLVLRTHYNGHYRYPRNVRPWAFGLTERIIRACEGDASFQSRERRLVAAFPVFHPVRSQASRLVLPGLVARFPVDDSVDAPPAESSADRAPWAATGRRHYPAYFARLKRSMLCAAFGGYFAPAVFPSTEVLAERVLYALNARMRRPTRTVMQFDSWRFWESLTAGCLTLQADYERYGCLLPEMPVSGTHYAGFDLGQRDCARWVREAPPESLASIAGAGRQWCRQHYSPEATARRLLRLLGEQA